MPSPNRNPFLSRCDLGPAPPSKAHEVEIEAECEAGNCSWSYTGLAVALLVSSLKAVFDAPQTQMSSGSIACSSGSTVFESSVSTTSFALEGKCQVSTTEHRPAVLALTSESKITAGRGAENNPEAKLPTYGALFWGVRVKLDPPTGTHPQVESLAGLREDPDAGARPARVAPGEWGCFDTKPLV